MRVPIELTKGPTNWNSTLGIRQPLDQIVDVSEFESLDLQLVIHQATFPQAINAYGAAILVLTSMQPDTEVGWVTLCSFPPILTPNASALRSVSGGILRYIRWSVPVLASGANIIFSIVGQGSLPWQHEAA